MNSITRESLLAQIAQIESMEPGKLCLIRQGPNGPYYNLQCREQGKNVTRYIPRDQLELAQTHTANFQQFHALVDQYVELVATQSRALREDQTQKKTKPPQSHSRKIRKSDN